MPRCFRIAPICLSIAICTGCIGSGSEIKRVNAKQPPHKVVKIAIDRHGVLGAAIAGELRNQGFDVVHPRAMPQLLKRIKMKEVDVNSPVSLGRLKTENIDTYLTSKILEFSEFFGNTPENVLVKVYSTKTGKAYISLEWENGGSLRAGTAADLHYKKSLDEAATEIVLELKKHFL